VKKGSIVLMLALALVVLISPRIIGRIAEQSMDDSLAWAANEQGDLVVTSTGFERGWFTSTGQHRIELLEGEMYDTARLAFDTAVMPVLIVDTRLDHGLIPVTSMARENGTLMPSLGSAVSKMSLELGDGSVVALPGELFSQVGLSGALRSRFILDPEGADTNGGRVDWGGADFLITADPSTGNVSVSGALNSIVVESALQTVIVGSVSVDVDLADSGFGFMLGPAKMTLESFAIIGADDTATAGPIHFESDSWIDSGRLAADITLRLENTPMPFGGFGGSGSLDIVARMENADAAAFGQLAQSLDAARSSGFDPTASLAFQEDVMRLLASGMKIHFDQLDIASPLGQITSRFDATLSRSDADDYSWATALMALDASADISLPAALVDMVTANDPDMHAVIGMGFLRKQGQFYTLEAAVKQGLLTVNGAPMPIPLSGLQ
jgi:hypothetical protein